MAELKGWKFKTDNKLRGAYGETDFDKKTIRVNKTKHKAASKDYAKQDSTLLNTIVHEHLHAQHPKMHEDSVRKLARAMASKMPLKQKSKMYKKFS